MHFLNLNKAKTTKDILDGRLAMSYNIIQVLHPLLKENRMECLEIKAAKLNKVF